MSLLLQVTNFLKKYRTKKNSSRTIRYMFPAFLSGTAIMGMMALTGASTDSFVYLEVPAQAIEVGDIFPVTIYVSAAVPINAIELEILFSADKVDVFGVDRGQSVLTIWTEDPVIKSNSVLLRGGTFKRGFLGDHQIATINFRATETGQYTITADNLLFVAGDGEGTQIPASIVPATELSLFNFDDDTSEEEIRVAIKSRASTDLNGDGKITLQDISAFMGAWSNRTQIHDFNGDGRMTFRDFSIILAKFFLQ